MPVFPLKTKQKIRLFQKSPDGFSLQLSDDSQAVGGVPDFQIRGAATIEKYHLKNKKMRRVMRRNQNRGQNYELSAVAISPVHFAT